MTNLDAWLTRKVADKIGRRDREDHELMVNGPGVAFPLYSGALISFGGLAITVLDAQQQRRTACDVRDRWVRPRCPSKRAGRRGTRRGWKRRNPPRWTYAFREMQGEVIVTPGQLSALRKELLQ